MARDTYTDLQTFIAVAREQSFTRAAAQLGISQSALSHTIRKLETQMKVRLLTRTTRSVALTEAGERLLRNIAPRFEAISAALAAVGEGRDVPAGTVRITASENAAENALWPVLARVLPQFPQIKVEVTVESRFVDIVAERYDMGVRLGDDLAKDMKVVQISAGMRVLIVGAPCYLTRRPPPLTPQDLAEHDCINLRLMTLGDLYPWELKKDGQAVNVRVNGQLAFNSTRQILNAAVAGFGLGYLPAQMAAPYLASGQLVAVLTDWSPVFPGYHLYYPSDRHLPRAMSVLIEAMRYSEMPCHEKA
nr:LysR family transcriptional regulator [uncultured Duganella sp.]